MGIGVGTWGLLVGVVGAVLVVLAVLLAGRWGARRSVGASGVGLLLLGLALSGVVDFVAQATLNPVRWVGLAAAGLGVLLLGSVGMLPGRGRRQRAAKEPAQRPPEVDSGRGRQPDARRQVGGGSEGGSEGGSDDMAEIEDILRRRGIQ